MTNKPVIIVTGADLAAEAMALLVDYALVFAGKTPGTADLVALAKQHNPVGIIVRYGSVTAEVMDAAPALKVISKHGTGTDTIDKTAAQARGITVTAAAGANAAAVAEHALALMLACAKSVVPLDARMHAGHWDKATHKSLELKGLTVGLVGLGAIGRRFARMCDAIGMRVMGFDPFATDLPSYVEAVPLATIWEASDVISLQCPLTVENKGMINAATLARCKPGVILINTARGGLIDEAALLDAVRSGRVAAAGLDSFAQEPMAVPHIFQGQPGFVLSPHIGGVTSAAYVNMGVAAATNTIAVLNQVREPAVGHQ
ncbi:NAD(P)-dependent oxidoreductase [Cupriavidus taiwanensis]|uniref:NAD(P)-dependent oxidoreductase n=1 Tax=Cupriavidus taiwanensis TaxID=164546 RepID=UPI00253FC20D|nr:NAD(P)-dependent oxidoreductase [Cupriavidus taiwanensis]MDK3024126.1 NAD(P)-dependent oxidoreductase [Cupriavidus taiwanensis]